MNFSSSDKKLVIYLYCIIQIFGVVFSGFLKRNYYAILSLTNNLANLRLIYDAIIIMASIYKDECISQFNIIRIFSSLNTAEPLLMKNSLCLFIKSLPIKP
ncbi:hypothetical protein GFK82_00610 [Candidatus Steffania adelgidicola]|nr:hypothetical protein GFK82_00610 [Candidatus Steffania adelgidicola]